MDPANNCPSPFGLGQSGGCRRPSGSASFQYGHNINDMRVDVVPETCSFDVLPGRKEVRILASPPVITSIAFEPELPPGVTALIVMNDDAPVPVENMLQVPAWTEPKSSCGALLHRFSPEARFLDQARFDVTNLRFLGGDGFTGLPQGTRAIVHGLNLRRTTEERAANIFAVSM